MKLRIPVTSSASAGATSKAPRAMPRLARSVPRSSLPRRGDETHRRRAYTAVAPRTSRDSALPTTALDGRCTLFKGAHVVSSRRRRDSKVDGERPRGLQRAARHCGRGPPPFKPNSTRSGPALGRRATRSSSSRRRSSRSPPAGSLRNSPCAPRTASFSLSLIGDKAYLVSHPIGTRSPVLPSNDFPQHIAGNINLEGATVPFWSFESRAATNPWGLANTPIDYEPPVTGAEELETEVFGNDTPALRGCYRQKGR
ncbi:hypothetical protein LX36DRAFT_740607, partial [Colletotrichum falcatum]